LKSFGPHTFVSVAFWVLPRFALPLFVLISACTINRGSESQSRFFDKQSMPVQLEGESYRINPCSEQVESTCNAATWNPSLCVLDSYDGRIYVRGSEVNGYGQNECQARRSLQENFCALGLDSRKAGLPYCTPDPTMGECKDLPLADCSEISDNETTPTLCYPTSYDGEPISVLQSPKGWGVGECRARNHLLNQACRLNLQPKRLGDVICRDDPGVSQCFDDLLPCSMGGRPQVCQWQSDQLVIKGLGTNKCEAINEIRYYLCQSGQSAPSNLTVQCSNL